MKKLENYKEDIHKCSKCGLCQSVCPVYQETGNDCSVSRGQFIMLDGVLKGELKLNRKINKYLDTCLKCGKCKEFCPTGIDVVNILMSAKHEYFKRSFRGKIYKFLESKKVFNTAINFLSVFFRVNKILRTRNRIIEEPTAKAIYFGGCIEKFRPEIRDYVVELLNKMNIEVLDTKFDCCGIPFLTTGNLERFEEQALENISKIKNLEFDYFITDCASCEYSWKQYSEYIEDEELKTKLDSINYKTIYELIVENHIKFKSKTPKIITLHKPCHERSFESIKTIIETCQNVEYREMEGYDDCCGFGGLEHPWSLKTVKKILSKKAKNIKNTQSDFVLTSCLGCVVSMMISTCFRPKIKRLISFLKEECEIVES